MGSKRSHEGYYMVDHRQSPGLPDQMMPPGMPPRSGQGIFEAPTFTCSHCPNVVLVNPKRNRPRGYCRKCDHYLCDSCEAVKAMNGGECNPYKKQMDELLEAAVKEQNRGVI
jgi:hypothetical protein